MSTRSNYLETDTGNKISRKSTICGPTHITIAGKTIIHHNVILRGDLRRAASLSTSGSTGGGGGMMITVGKYCIFGEGCIVRPGGKCYKGVFSFYPVKIGDFVSIGAGSIVEAASIGNGVEIGKNCIIGALAIIKDNAKLREGSIVPPGATLPSLTEWAGSPARPVGTLPEATPEIVEAKAKLSHQRFQPE